MAGRGSRTWAELLKVSAKEIKSKLQPPPIQPSSVRQVYKFDNQAVLDSFLVSTDKSFGGYSTASLTLNSTNSAALFKGHLSTKLPANSRVKQSGYCMTRSKPLPSTLLGNRFHDLEAFTGLELILRGDGRSYILSLNTDSMQPEDLFQAFVYTKGGPHWQCVQIPFSDFLLTNMGFVQNEQTLMNTGKIKTIGILLADGLDGPFELELQEINAVKMRKPLSEMDVQKASAPSTPSAKAASAAASTPPPPPPSSTSASSTPPQNETSSSAGSSPR